MMKYPVHRVSYEYQGIVNLMALWPNQPHMVGIKLHHYTGNWDKIKWCGECLDEAVETLLRDGPKMPPAFKQSYTDVRSKIIALIDEIPHPVEYVGEESSTDFARVRGKWIAKAWEWFPIVTDSNGNVVGHAGDKVLVFASKEHVERLTNLWICLIDCFVKKGPTSDTSSRLPAIKAEIEVGKSAAVYR